MTKLYEYNGKEYKSEAEVEAAIIDRFPACNDDDLSDLFDREWSDVVEYQECDVCNGTGDEFIGVAFGKKYWHECEACNGKGKLVLE